MEILLPTVAVMIVMIPTVVVMIATVAVIIAAMAVRPLNKATKGRKMLGVIQ